jgi:hypothetical protein
VISQTFVAFQEYMNFKPLVSLATGIYRWSIILADTNFSNNRYRPPILEAEIIGHLPSTFTVPKCVHKIPKVHQKFSPLIAIPYA